MYFSSADGVARQEGSLVCHRVRAEVNLGADDDDVHASSIGCKSAQV